MFFILIFGIIYSSNLSAQDSPKSKKKLQKLASEYFNSEQFSKALPLYLKLDSLVPNNFEIKYNIGACYLNTPYEKTKGISFLEFALKNGGNLLPNAVFYDLGTLYHLNYQFDEAIAQFNHYLKTSAKTDPFVSTATRMIDICNNAKEVYNNPVPIEIQKLEESINTDNSEITPLISADEEMLYFTRSFSKFYGQIDIEILKKIYYSIFKEKKWQKPIEITIKNPIPDMQISLAGSSPDGEYLFFSIGNDVSTDLYSCQVTDGKCSELIKLPEIINSPFWEGKISITPDGQELFFSSNRPGGYGGKDIYKVYKNNEGNWSNILNLGPNVNSEFDEDAPFIHPDGRTLYYSSNGHNTIGGYDIFYSERLESQNDWTDPTNIGYPINTTSDDIGFVTSADGNNAYFSSANSNLFGKHDIYKAILHKTIPLTLIKGTILGGDPPKPIKARIRVIDHETKERLRYIYNPNPKTGKYLMIFPPNKNYDMLIEAEEYQPQLINIFVPNQVYFFELFQEIFLKQVKVTEKDSIIGQEITINNTFYDLYKTKISDSLYEHNQLLHKKQIDDLLKVVENIINTTDSIGLNQLDSISSNYKKQIIGEDSSKINRKYDNLIDMIETAITKEDSISLLLLDANTIYNDVTNQVFFFDMNKYVPDLKPMIFDNDTIYRLPAINTVDIKKNNIQDENNIVDTIKPTDLRNSPEDIRKYIYVNQLNYETGSYAIQKKYLQMLSGITQILLLNSNLGIELHGYADPDGTKESNRELSINRAFKVMEFFVSKQVESKRIIMIGHGELGIEKAMSNEEMKKLRRVEIKVFELE